MDAGKMILELRMRAGLSQDELAEQLYVTRQAVSRWENGETTPNIETLMLLSERFGVSINELLGAPRQPVCQCCGLPIEEGAVSKEPNGTLNEDYCKWCYADGMYTYDDLDELVDNYLSASDGDAASVEGLRSQLRARLSKLHYWKRYADLGGEGAFDAFKQQLMAEFNALQVEGMPKVEALNALLGAYVNLPYRLPNGATVKFLDDRATYLGNELPCEFDEERCFGIVGNMEFLLVCTYGAEGTDPELVIYKKR